MNDKSEENEVICAWMVIEDHADAIHLAAQLQYHEGNNIKGLKGRLLTRARRIVEALESLPDGD